MIGKNFQIDFLVSVPVFLLLAPFFSPRVEKISNRHIRTDPLTVSLSYFTTAMFLKLIAIMCLYFMDPIQASSHAQVDMEDMEEKFASIAFNSITLSLSLFTLLYATLPLNMKNNTSLTYVTYI